LALLRVCVGVFQQVLHAPSVLLTISASRCLVSILLGGAVQDSYLYSTDMLLSTRV
jgi:hypothetical protein